jgi:hypothetical protein
MEPATDAAGRTGNWVSLKNARRVTVVFHVKQGNAATIAVSINQATAIAGTGSKVLTNAVPIWRNLDCSVNDTLVRDTDAKNYTTDAATKNKQIIFQIDPNACMDIANGFDCITIITGASNAANLTEAQVFLEMEYEQATPPSAVVD